MKTITEIVFEKELDKQQEIVKKLAIPLGTRRPPRYYEQLGYIPEDDIVYMQVSKREMQSIFVLASSGRGKTQLIKRLLAYFHLFNFKICVFEPKEKPEYIQMNEEGKFRFLHPKEKPMKILTKGFTPYFVAQEVWGSLLRNFEIFSLHINTMRREEDWQTLEFYAGSSTKMLEYLRMKRTFPQIMQLIKTDKMHPSIRQSLLLKVGNIYQNKVFEENTQPIDIMKWWDEGYAISICYFNQFPRYMSLYTGKILDQIRQNSLRSFFPKMIVIEDLPPISPPEADPEVHIAKKKIRDGLTLWRSLGFNFILSAQNTSLIDPIDFYESSISLVGNIGNVDLVARKVSNPAIVEAIRKLVYDKNKQIRQWCYIHADNYSFDLFYPFQSLVGHTF